MHLETERLVFRSFTIEDLEAFAKIQSDADVMRYIGGVQSFENSKDQLLEIIRHDQETGLARFAVERVHAPGLIGYCGFKRAGSFVDLGYQYAKTAWGQGIGLEAAKIMREYGRSKLRIKKMEAGGLIKNLASVQIMQRLEFPNCEELLFEGKPAIRFYD